jgi:hypothetical protein
MTFPGWLGWLLLALPCGTAPVCKCGIASIEAQFAHSETVFSGTVLRVGGLDGRQPLPEQPVTLSVTRVWKGRVAADTVVVRDRYACGAGFTEGTPFLVYAVAEADGRLVTSFCERSRPLSGAPRDGVDDLPVLESLAARATP